MTRNSVHYNEQRDTAGVTVTMRRRTDGELQSAHQGGGTKVALRRVLSFFDAAEWCVASVSTPRTILRDVKADRILNSTGIIPENILLGQIGATEYLP